MRLFVSLLAPLTVLAASGCALLPKEAPPVSASYGAVAFGRAANAGRLIVRPDRLVEDNRCPMNARCITAGRVVIEASVWDGAAIQRVRLQSDMPTEVAGRMLSIEAVTPESFMTDARPAARDYRFRFALM